MSAPTTPGGSAAIPRAQVATVVLAAGAGKRIGGPKALLAWPAPKGGQPVPLAIAHAEERLGAESGRVLVVTRKPIVTSLLGYVRPGIDLLASDAADDLGPAGSLAFAFPRLGEVSVVVVTPVDTPPARPETVARLLAALAADPSLLAARPVCRGRAGHPVALRHTGHDGGPSKGPPNPSALARYAAPDPPPLRDHLQALGAACAGVDVTDPTVLIDLNTPADVMGTLGALPRFFK